MAGVLRRIAGGLVLLCLAGLQVACSGSSQTPGVILPPASASPQQVARIYLRAAVSGNCAVTAELTAPRATWSWCKDPKLLAYRCTGSAVHIAASEAGRSEECVQFEMYTHGSSDGSMPVGWQPWSLCFVSTHVGWRVLDQGQG